MLVTRKMRKRKIEPSSPELVWRLNLRQRTSYINNMVTRYPSQALIENSSSRSQFKGSLCLSNDQLISNDPQPLSSRNDHSTVGLALGPPQYSTSGFHTGSSSIQSSAIDPFDDWSHNRDNGVDAFFAGDEIRVRSNEILENEDMQHLLRLFSIGGHASMSTEDGYSFPSFMPSPMPSFDEDRSRPRRSVLGWLKIKAAMRWGFFIKKIAAEKRVQIEELDE